MNCSSRFSSRLVKDATPVAYDSSPVVVAGNSEERRPLFLLFPTEACWLYDAIETIRAVSRPVPTPGRLGSVVVRSASGLN